MRPAGSLRQTLVLHPTGERIWDMSADQGAYPDRLRTRARPA